MGFLPREIREMTFDEFDACITGWNRAQGNGPAPELSDADYNALAALTDIFNGTADG